MRIKLMRADITRYILARSKSINNILRQRSEARPSRSRTWSHCDEVINISTEAAEQLRAKRPRSIPKRLTTSVANGWKPAQAAVGCGPIVMRLLTYLLRQLSASVNRYQTGRKPALLFTAHASYGFTGFTLFTSNTDEYSAKNRIPKVRRTGSSHSLIAHAEK